MTKAKKTKHIGEAEFRRLTSSKDPVIALDSCRDALQHMTREYREYQHISVGALTHTANRICASEEEWRKFIDKPFWQKSTLYGRRPTMADRSNGLGFVFRYGKGAVTRIPYQNASRHAVVARYLLANGVKPSGFAAYLGKPGQGIKATYEKASPKKDAPKSEDRVAPKRTSLKKGSKVTSQDQGSISRVDRKSAAGSARQGMNAALQEASSATMPMARLIGERELMEQLFRLADDGTMDLRVKAVRDEHERRRYEVVKLLHRMGTGQTTSERRKSNLQSGKTIPRRLKPIRKVRRTG